MLDRVDEDFSPSRQTVNVNLNKPFRSLIPPAKISHARKTTILYSFIYFREQFFKPLPQVFLGFLSTTQRHV